jgi:hypothetical protein
MARSEIAESNTSSKRKYTKERKADEIDFSIITILELLECLSLIILTPANFWKTLTDILNKPKVKFNLKKILNKLHHNLKAFNVEKSEKSWNIIFDLMKSQDWSTISFDAQTSLKLEDLFIQYTSRHEVLLHLY